MTSDIGLLARADLDPLFWPNLRVDHPSAWHGHVPFAHWLVTAMRPSLVVELGSHAGVSFAALCQAAQRLQQGTRCVAVDTWKGDAHSGAYDDHVYQNLAGFVAAHFPGLATLRRATFDDALADFADGSIDLLHIDGFHTYEAVRHDFETWRPKLSTHGVVLFHDIAVHARDFGVWRFWDEISARHPNFAFAHAFGLGVLAVGPAPAPPVAALCAAPPELAKNLQARFAALGQIQEQTHAARMAARAVVPDPIPTELPEGDTETSINELFIAERFLAPPYFSTLVLPRDAVVRGPKGCTVWIVSSDGTDWRHGIVQAHSSGPAIRLTFPAFGNLATRHFRLFVTSPVQAPEKLPAVLVQMLTTQRAPIVLDTTHVPAALPNRPPRAVYLLQGTQPIPGNREPAPQA